MLMASQIRTVDVSYVDTLLQRSRPFVGPLEGMIFEGQTVNRTDCEFPCKKLYASVEIPVHVGRNVWKYHDQQISANMRCSDRTHGIGTAMKV